MPLATKLTKGLKQAAGVVSTFVREPALACRVLLGLPETVKGLVSPLATPPSARLQGVDIASDAVGSPPSPNPLQAYFESHQTGRGIWKWTHYFEIYHRHLAKFVGRDVHIAEIGIFSGGSLDMWKGYFGPGCNVYGVDIQEACKAYESERTRILIGDQADRQFWKRFREQVPTLDILVDDGGHMPEQQIVTLEEALPHLRPGGVFICEDIHALHNPFAAYVRGLCDNLNDFSTGSQHGDSIVCQASELQKWIGSVHLYPYMTVIEKSERPVQRLVCPRHGTEWQPFL